MPKQCPTTALFENSNGAGNDSLKRATGSLQIESYVTCDWCALREKADDWRELFDFKIEYQVVLMYLIMSVSTLPGWPLEGGSVTGALRASFTATCKRLLHPAASALTVTPGFESRYRVVVITLGGSGPSQRSSVSDSRCTLPTAPKYSTFSLFPGKPTAFHFSFPPIHPPPPPSHFATLLQLPYSPPIFQILSSRVLRLASEYLSITQQEEKKRHHGYSTLSLASPS